MTKNEIIKKDMDEESIRLGKKVLPAVVIVVIIAVLISFTYIQRRQVVNNIEQVSNQMAEYVADNIAKEVDYATSSIKLAAVNVSQSMTSETLDNPAEVILPMVDNSPFGSIEYIRPDGMNVMNIGQPFDASDRVYYIEGIKGNTGVWNNYHPKTTKDTLVNCYTPLLYQGEIAGVITGYIEASAQLAPLFETQLYGQPIYGLLVDENNMVICSTVKSEYVKDLTLDMYLEQFGGADVEKQKMTAIIDSALATASFSKGPHGSERISTVLIPETKWTVVVIVPDMSFVAIVDQNTRPMVISVVLISLILISYAAYILLINMKRRKDIARRNALLEEENRAFDQENKRTLAEMSEIHDIVASSGEGIWRIELLDGKAPRMFADDTMMSLLGISGQSSTPEQIYEAWFNNIKPESLQSVLNSVDRMKQGYFDENTYLWLHPEKGPRYVRCGGTSKSIEGGYSLSGFHFDVDDVVREDQAKVIMLQEALDEKNEYYTALGKLEGIFYSMHILNLVEDTVIEFTAKNQVKEIVNHTHGAAEMMVRVMSTLITDEYHDKALAFTDLRTIADRMKGKRTISMQLLGKNAGWIEAIFVAMESDEQDRPTKVIYATKVIDAEKKYEEGLIRKSQTDELTGLLNRRAYEDDIYEHDGLPSEDDFIYISLDVNGLKVINDTKGHTAGDELIVGACQCMKKSLGPYGKLYRIGGDEFVAILFCDEENITNILADFDDTMANWSGELIDSLSISYGWISKHEQPGFSVRHLGAIAEQRMYEAKADYYSRIGVDRRGQQDAHKVLCELYTKILKINTTEDSYQIINMDMSEQTAEKGFADKISVWLKSFGESGQVHPDDLESYLEQTSTSYIDNYFEQGKTSLHIFYRRKYAEEFKQVMMEMIPAGDYSSDNHSYYLYVKDVDR